MNPLLTRLAHPNIYNWLTNNSKKLPADYAVMLVHPEAAAEAVAKFRHELPRVEIYYAYKCFSNAEVVKAIDSLIDGYDVASQGECEELIKLGVKPERLLFANPVKIPAQVAYAYKKGVMGFTFQSADELKKMAELAPGSDVIVRVKVPDEHNTTGQAFSKKFGVEPVLVKSLMLQAKDLGLNPKGVSFHVGSQSSLPDLWTTAIELCMQLIDDCNQEGLNLDLLDIGGGFPAAYETGDYAKFERITAAIRQSLKDNVPENIRVISEPGRIIVANTAAIITNVISRETRGDQEWIFLDTGVFQALLEVFEFHRLLQTPVLLSDREAGRAQFTLAGPTCDSDDTIEMGVDLPADINRGDRIVITLAGAYTLAYGSSFNGIKPPELVYV